MYSVIKSRTAYNMMLLLLVGALSFEVFYYPDVVKNGVIQALSLCGTVILPSIFPFMMLCEFCSVMGLTEFVLSKVRFVGKLLFGRFDYLLGVFLVSAVGGYPAAAVMLKNSCERKTMDHKTACLAALFCYNPSPAFVITAVGKGMLSSVKQGVIIYLTTVAVSLLTGAVMTRSARFAQTFNQTKSDVPLSEGLVLSVALSSSAIMTMCATVMLFGAFVEPIKNPIIISISEITLATKYLCKNAHLSTLAAAISFGGIATHIQVMMFAKSFDLKYLRFLAVRIINATVVFLTVLGIEKLFPNVVKTFSSSTLPVPSVSSSPAASAGLIITCVIFLCSVNLSEKKGMYAK